MKMFWFATFLLVQPAFGSVGLIDKDDWKIDMSGFVETDLIYDSTQSSFAEIIGNSPVSRGNKPDGAEHGRTMMSIRNSRLGFNVQAPAMENWKSRGYFEFDLLGHDPSPEYAPATGASNSENGFFNNPTVRIRHIFIQTEHDSWQFTTGQTWNLMGWQPYYFVPTIQVSPVPGMLYNRTAQMRAMKTFDLKQSSLQVALGIMKPPQRDGRLPALEGGARWAMNSWGAAFTGGATGSNKVQPLSVGVSGTVRQFAVVSDPSLASSSGTSTYTGKGMSVDFLAPIIPSRDGKSTSNNLVVGGEFTIGQGYGDEFSGWTAGQKNPLAGAAGADANTDLDAGIGGWDSNSAAGNFSLMNVQTMNLYVQYHLPERTKSWAAAGYSMLTSSNASAFYDTWAGATGASPNGGTPGYGKEEAIFANISHDCSRQIRTGLEWMRVRTTYTDAVAVTDDRFQYSAWFIF